MKLKEPSKIAEFGEDHYIAVYHCTVYNNHCSYIEFRYGINVIESYEIGHASVHDLARDYLDHKIGNTNDPLELAYYWYCYKQIGREYDFIPRLNHDLKGRVATLLIYDTFDNRVNTVYIKDEDGSVITFKDKQSAIDWHEEGDSDIKMFVIPATYIPRYEYSLMKY